MKDLQNNFMDEKIPNVIKDDILKTIDEKLDIEAVAQMVEHREFSTRLNQSLQQRFNEISLLLQQKDQLIASLRNRLENLELDIALLKRVFVPSVTAIPQAAKQSQVSENNSRQGQSSTIQTPSVPVTKTEISSENGEVITPPDFSELRKMTVEEPKNKFVPPQKDENQTE